jgi:hypothetical protein
MDRVKSEIGLLSEQGLYCIADSVVLNDHDRSATREIHILKVLDAERSSSWVKMVP